MIYTATEMVTNLMVHIPNMRVVAYPSNMVANYTGKFLVLNISILPCSLHGPVYHIFAFSIITWHTIPYQTITYHIIPFHPIPYHGIPDHVMSHHIIAYHSMSYHRVYANPGASQQHCT